MIKGVTVTLTIRQLRTATLVITDFVPYLSQGLRLRALVLTKPPFLTKKPAIPNVFNIALWHGSTPPKELFNLPLKRLSIHTFSYGFEDQIQDIKKTDNEKYREWCSRITHIAWGSVTLTACQSLSALAFPNLTHFLFGDWSEDRRSIVNYVVGSFRHLEVLVILLGKTGSETKGSYVQDSLEGIVFEDIRVVVMRSFFVTDWVKGTKGEHDLWRVAEQTVKERRKPKVVSR
ncbi:hypothetical protein BDN72DRAFT_915462 [Pluteus cervinus]|uniref:Uncharacterized protein n=1 Tax=Pluteus cervinus TaxID=181527 RepID=A0ACD3BAB1_9AGAR|nr:hypothetical protein BDN72DRAFT_915462 [Pluteus cervinus]